MFSRKLTSGVRQAIIKGVGKHEGKENKPKMLSPGNETSSMIENEDVTTKSTRDEQI